MSTAPSSEPPIAPLNRLRIALEAARRPFYTFGDIPLTSSSSSPFELLVKPTLTSIPFPLPSSSLTALTPLLEACKQATFGRGNQDILDPTYRRALVLHAKDFGIAPHSALDPYALGIISEIEKGLFRDGFDFNLEYESGTPRRRVVARLDKLNVYSQGDFFKSHVDTPRAPNMFGTLLINLPVEHEGGALVVRAPVEGERAIPASIAKKDEGLEKFETKWGGTDSLGWLAFFSDCSHEVLPVVSGHRVTLTYNLFIEGPEPSEPSTEEAPLEPLGGVSDISITHLRTAITSFLDESDKRLLFHLDHKYPLDVQKKLALNVIPFLKGRDLLLYRALLTTTPSLSLSFHFAWHPRDELYSSYDPQDYPQGTLIFPSNAFMFSGEIDDSEGGLLYQAQQMNAKTTSDTELGVLEVNGVDSEFMLDSQPDDDHGGGDTNTNGAGAGRESYKIQHARVLKRMQHNAGGRSNKHSFGYMTYGNESVAATSYASICLIVGKSGTGIEGWKARDF